MVSVPFNLRGNGIKRSVFSVIGSILFLFISASVSYGLDLPATADPGRLSKDQEKKPAPQSELEPVVPEREGKIARSELRKIRFELKGVRVKGSTVYKKMEFRRFYRRGLHKIISMADVYRIADAITRMYRKDGYLLSKAFVPAQTIEGGVVTIEVLEGYIDGVAVRGDRRGPLSLLKGYVIGIVRSRPLKAEDLERYLLLINDLPGLSVKSVLEPSKKNPGGSKLTLVLSHKVVDGYLSADNRGTKFNGPFQFSAGGNLNSLFGIYEQAGLRAVSSAEPGELAYVGGHLDLPVFFEGTRFLMSGSASFTEPGHTLSLFDVEGESFTAGFQVLHPLVRSRSQNLSMHFGFVSLQTETTIFGALASEDRIRVLNGGLAYDWVDSLRSVNQITFEVSQGLNILDATKTGNLDLSRAEGTSDFTKLHGELMRLQQIVPDLNLLAEAAWQYSFDPLLASEEFGVGGARFVRGYDSSEITGDHGVAFKGELQYNWALGFKYLLSVQPYAFYDYGRVWRKFTPIGLKSETHEDLSSLGLGFRFNIMEWISGYAEGAKPLDREVNSIGNNDMRFFFNLVARY